MTQFNYPERKEDLRIVQMWEQSADFEALVVEPNSNYGLDKRASERALGQREYNSKQELDRRLDLALEETFPASDPVSVIIASNFDFR